MQIICSCFLFVLTSLQVPVFVFGQTSTYSWYRPGPAVLINWISRHLGAVPMGIWGRWGSPIPHQKPMHVVMGKPMQVPHVEHPSKEQVTTTCYDHVDGWMLSTVSISLSTTF